MTPKRDQLAFAALLRVRLDREIIAILDGVAKDLTALTALVERHNAAPHVKPPSEQKPLYPVTE